MNAENGRCVWKRAHQPSHQPVIEEDAASEDDSRARESRALGSTAAVSARPQAAYGKVGAKELHNMVGVKTARCPASAFGGAGPRGLGG